MTSKPCFLAPYLVREHDIRMATAGLNCGKQQGEDFVDETETPAFLDD